MNLASKLLNFNLIAIFSVLLLNSCFKPTPLFNAIKQKDFNKVDSFINVGVSVNEIPPKAFCTPLYWAIGYGSPEIVELLLKRGADVNNGMAPWTPLQYAVYKKNAVFVKLLLEYKPNIDEINSYRNQTALDIAIQSKQDEIINLIREARKSQLGNTPERPYNSFSKMKYILPIITTTLNGINDINNNNSSNVTTSSSLNNMNRGNNTNITLKNEKNLNKYLEDEAKKARENELKTKENELKKAKENDYYYNYYMDIAKKEKEEAEYDLRQAEKHNTFAEINIKQGKDATYFLTLSKEAYSNYEWHKAKAKEAEKEAEFYKK